MLDEKTLVNFCNNKRILVVGNAQTLIRKDNSKFIDSFDVVIRINHAVPSNLIGKKTDIWICNYNTVDRQYPEYKRFLPKFVMKMNENTYIDPKLKSNLYVWPVGEFKKFRSLLSLNKPSTGLSILFWLTTKVNANISIIGFDSFKTKTFYYHKDIHQKYHNGNKERDWINKLINSKQIIKYQ